MRQLIRVQVPAWAPHPRAEASWMLRLRPPPPTSASASDLGARGPGAIGRSPALTTRRPRNGGPVLDHQSRFAVRFRAKTDWQSRRRHSWRGNLVESVARRTGSPVPNAERAGIGTGNPVGGPETGSDPIGEVSATSHRYCSSGRLAQSGQSASFTPRTSGVRIPHRPPLAPRQAGVTEPRRGSVPARLSPGAAEPTEAPARLPLSAPRLNPGGPSWRVTWSS
jgi:hypothetical protein